MAGSQTDVKLVIKAQTEGEKAVSALWDAVNKLVGAQNKLAESGGKASSLIDVVREAMVGLTNAVSALDGGIDKAQAAFDRQSKTLSETKQQLTAVTGQMEAAEQAAASLTAKVEAGGEQAAAFKAKLEGVSGAQKELAAQARKLTADVASQEAQLAKSAAAMDRLRGTARSGASAATFAVGTDPLKAAESIGIFVRMLDPLAADSLRASQAVSAFLRTLPPIAPAAQEAAQKTRTLWQEIKDLAAAMFTIPSAAQRAAASTQAFGERSKFGSQAAHIFRYEVISLVQSFLGLYAAVGAIKAVLDAFQALQSAENKLGVVFEQNEAQVAREMQFLREQAVRLGLSFTQLVDQFSTFAVAAQSAGFSLGTTRKVFVAVSDASRVLHLSTQQVNNVFLALTEMLSKGLIQSTQLRKQLGTDLPGAVSLFAEALGISTEKLDQLMRRGELLANEDTFGKIADRLNQKYGPQLAHALESAQTQIGRFQALLQQAEIRIGQSGFIDQLNVGLKQLNAYLKTENADRFFSEVGAGLGHIIAVIPDIVHNFDLITGVFKAWLAIKIDLWLLTLISRMQTAGSVAKAMWTAIGGWPGLLISGATFVLETLVGKWLTGLDSATKALDDHGRILDAVRKAYDEAGRSVDLWASKIKGASVVQIEANLSALNRKLAVGRTDIQLPGPAGLSDSAYQQLQKFVGAFHAGDISAQKLKDDITAIAQANLGFKATAASMQDALDKLIEIEGAISEVKTALRVGLGKGTAADVKALGLDVADGWNAATSSAERFTDALDKMRKTVPDLKEQLHFETNLERARAAYLEAIDAAVKELGKQDGSPDALIRAATTTARLAEAKKIYDAVVEKLHAYAAAETAKNFPVDNKAIIERIIYVEGGYAAKNNPASSAYGVGQFTKETWLELFNQIRPALADLSDAAKLALRANADIARDAIDLKTKQNQLALANAGIPATPANTYLAHFLGAQGAIKMILANPDELASKIAGAAATKANPSILGGGHTVSDVLNFAALKMGGVSPITATGATEAENFTQALDEQIQAWKDEAQAIYDAATQSERALFIQRQISEEAKKARAAGTTLLPAKAEEIRAVYGALYDAQHQAQNTQKAVEAVVGLSEQRATAIQELQNAFKDGSSAAEVERLKEKVAELTRQLLAAIPAAQGLVNAMSGEAGEKVQAALDKVNLQLKTLKTGLVDAKQMNTLIADTGVSAWDNFNQTLQQTRKVFVALRTAVLQFFLDFAKQISDAILKQQLLNALSGTKIGESLANLVNGTTGTGGVSALGAASGTAATAVGGLGLAAGVAAAALQAMAVMSAINSPSVGGAENFLSTALTVLGELHTGGIAGLDGKPRVVASEIFAAARRFHSGGLPGLRSNEVPAILERGEEVLTRGDPRHVINGGGRPSMPVKIVNTFDREEAAREMLNTAVMERGILNVIRSNKGAIKAALA